MELWIQMYEDFPLYEISSQGNIRKMKNKKVSNLRYGRDVLLKDKNNAMKWVNVKHSIYQYFTLDEIFNDDELSNQN